MWVDDAGIVVPCTAQKFCQINEDGCLVDETYGGKLVCTTAQVGYYVSGGVVNLCTSQENCDVDGSVCLEEYSVLGKLVCTVASEGYYLTDGVVDSCTEQLNCGEMDDAGEWP